ncbi:MAG: DUF4062 domain-containing protein [Pyrinomonadaceae bacterium]
MPTPRLSVFVSSKMKELARERLAIGASLNELEVDAWIFEKDAPASPESIQKVFLNEVKSADLYIGIFWKDIGDRTIEEFEYAQKLGKDCLIYEKRRGIDGKRSKELQDFLERLGDVENGLTIKWFNNSKELAVLVKKEVALWQVKKIRQKLKQPLFVGSEVAKTCDRTAQETDFATFLDNKEDYYKFPRVCIIHGNNCEAHESLVKRFHLTRIKDYAEKKYNAGEAVVGFKEIRIETLPGAGLNFQKKSLLEKLFSLWSKYHSQTPGDLSKLLAAIKEKVLIIQHNIYFSRYDGTPVNRFYDGTTVNLVRAYLDFWDEAVKNPDSSENGVKADMPEVFLFFNIIYPPGVKSLRFGLNFPRKASHEINKFFVARALRKKLSLNERLQEENSKAHVNKEGTRIMLREISCVRPDDVRRWLDMNGYSSGVRSETLEREIEGIFITNRGKRLKCRCMSDVEPELAEVVKAIQPPIENI